MKINERVKEGFECNDTIESGYANYEVFYINTFADSFATTHNHNNGVIFAVLVPEIGQGS